MRKVAQDLILYKSQKSSKENSEDILGGAFTQMCRSSSERLPAKSKDNFLLVLKLLPVGGRLKARSLIRKNPETRNLVIPSFKGTLIAYPFPFPLPRSSCVPVHIALLVIVDDHWDLRGTHDMLRCRKSEARLDQGL